MKLVAKAVAALTLRGMMYRGFPNLKKLLSPEQLDSEGVHALIGIAEETISVKEFPILREHGCWRDIGASHHSVRDCETVQRILDDRGLKCYLGKHLEVQVPSYKFYNLSAKAARENGEEVVRLEHFALVVIAWKLQKDRPSKMAMDAKTCPANVGIIGDVELLVAEPRVKSWRSDGFKRLPEDVMMKIMNECCVGGWMQH
ncbi:hypothetical protein RHSIM_Rhsim03G0258300 [Rhododendron simsii]|uniref:Uncharacterized protein n=1 Tax=Rhododendron simsii TaxID=118357 RepID=A0A834H5P4_RHOSS|nr:hypothetical protein RHSIM_Rhsim03G0258300 [Rhododendron simsii]